MRVWVSMHVSDHSGFHYRQFLLKELIAEICKRPAHTSTSCSPQRGCSTVPEGSPCPHSCSHSNGEPSGQEAGGEEDSHADFTTVLQLFHQEMDLCSDLIQSFPGHETLWSHRWETVGSQWLQNGDRRRIKRMFCLSRLHLSHYGTRKPATQSVAGFALSLTASIICEKQVKKLSC